MKILERFDGTVIECEHLEGGEFLKIGFDLWGEESSEANRNDIDDEDEVLGYALSLISNGVDEFDGVRGGCKHKYNNKRKMYMWM